MDLATRPRRRDQAADGGVAAAEFFHDQGIGDVVAAHAAVLFGDGHAEEAEFTEARYQVPGTLGAVPLYDVG